MLFAAVGLGALLVMLVDRMARAPKGDDGREVALREDVRALVAGVQQRCRGLAVAAIVLGVALGVTLALSPVSGPMLTQGAGRVQGVVGPAYTGGCATPGQPAPPAAKPKAGTPAKAAPAAK